MAVDAAPPGGLVDDAELAVDGVAADAALAEDLAVLIGGGEAPDGVDQDDEQGWGVAADVHGREVDGVVLERAVGEGEGAEGLVGDDGEGEGEEQVEAGRGVAEEADEAVEQAAVARAVVFDAVAEGGGDGQPADEEAEGGSFEAAVGGRRDGFGQDLFRIALVGDEGPVSRDYEKEILCVVEKRVSQLVVQPQRGT